MRPVMLLLADVGAPEGGGVGRQLPTTHDGVLGQIWRGGPRQARLAQALQDVEIRALDDALWRAAGELLGATAPRPISRVDGGRRAALEVNRNRSA